MDQLRLFQLDRETNELWKNGKRRRETEIELSMRKDRSDYFESKQKLEGKEKVKLTCSVSRRIGEYGRSRVHRMELSIDGGS